MTPTFPSPIVPESRRVSIRLPRPLWIGLAAAVLAVVALGLQFGLPIYRQEVAIRAIERLGGVAERQVRGPQWLRDWIGEKQIVVLDRVTAVGLERVAATDDAMVHLKSLYGLQTLMLNHSRISDAGLANLAMVASLEWLELPGTQITDCGLAHLKRLTRLEGLDLTGTRVAGPGLANLAGASALRRLWISETTVTDSGLEHLKGLVNLEELDLRNTRLTDAGLRHLRGLTNLKTLWLDQTQVTDDGLKYLTGMASLEELAWITRRSQTRESKGSRRHCLIAKSFTDEGHATAISRPVITRCNPQSLSRGA